MKRVKYGVKWKKKGQDDTTYKFEDGWNGGVRFFYNINRAYKYCQEIIKSSEGGEEAMVEELTKDE